MFEHPGRKIEIWATSYFWIITIASILGGVYYAYVNIDRLAVSDVLIVALVCLILIPLTTYISTLFVVGFGHLVENSEEIKEQVSDMNSKIV